MLGYSADRWPRAAGNRTESLEVADGGAGVSPVAVAGSLDQLADRDEGGGEVEVEVDDVPSSAVMRRLGLRVHAFAEHPGVEVGSPMGALVIYYRPAVGPRVVRGGDACI